MPFSTSGSAGNVVEPAFGPYFLEEPDRDIDDDDAGADEGVGVAPERHQREPDDEEGDIDRAQEVRSEDLGIGAGALESGVMPLPGGGAARGLRRGQPLNLIHADLLRSVARIVGLNRTRWRLPC